MRGGRAARATSTQRIGVPRTREEVLGREKLGEVEENANARHYYLTQARETRRGEVEYFHPPLSTLMLHQFKLSAFMASLTDH